MSNQLKDFFSDIMDLQSPYSISRIVQNQEFAQQVDIYI